MIEVTYIDHMGSDLSVVNAARVSFGRESEFDVHFDWDYDLDDFYPVYSLKPQDERLIKYLARHKHTSPFGHAFASFHVKASLFVARQLVKHKFLRWNEISRRYVDNKPEFYEPGGWREKSEDKKQGSSSDTVGATWGNMATHEAYGAALYAYEQLLADNVCPEQARMVLPQSMMTEWYWSGSLDAFANMCNLRLAEDTQYESRLVAQQIDEKMAELFPVSWKELIYVEKSS